MGTIDLWREGTDASGASEKSFFGEPQAWIDSMIKWYTEYRQDTFVFWPVGGNTLVQIEAFTQAIVPAVKEALTGS